MIYKFAMIGFILMTIFATALLSSCQMQGSYGQNDAQDITATQNTAATQDLTAKEAYDRLLNISIEMAYMDTMISLSQWDQDISMPQNGTEYRAKAQSYMVDLKNKKWIDPEFGRLLAIANRGSDWSTIETANLRLWNRNYNKRIKLPPTFAARESMMASLAQAAWEDARAKDNYSLFEPHLKALVELNKEKARYWGYEEHPYDALLDDFMPGMTVAKCDKLFDVVKPEIIELIKEIEESSERAPESIYGNSSYPEEKQLALAKNITSALGFNYGSGILVPTKRHPETYDIGEHDVRTSTRIDPHNPEPAIMSAIHEGGHGIASQGIPGELYGMPVGTYPGMDMAEAEARLFENNLGRSRAFWQYWLPQMKEEFRPEMDNVSLDETYRYVNRLNIIPIRINADEVSYILHVIIRYEIERDLFEGKISVDELPAIWKEKYKEYLGLDITDDRDGILQDVHWAAGYFGYFPAYAIASMNAAQLESAMRRDHPDLDQRFASGDFTIPVIWMEEHIYKYGAVYDTPELMKIATSNETEANDFLEYLDAKYKEIYNLH
jgi:carboxypeptidase Taq